MSLDASPLDRRGELSPAVHREGYVVHRGEIDDHRWVWSIEATWDATVHVELAAVEESRPPTVNEIIAQGWRAAASLLPTLTGIPDERHVPAYLAVTLDGDGTFFVNLGTSHQRADRWVERPIGRWATMAAPSDDELHSVYREITRSMGVEAHEPGP